MNPANEQKLKYHFREVATLLKEETPHEQLENFEPIELAARKHILETVRPEIGAFFFFRGASSQRKKRQVKTCIGIVPVAVGQSS